jgi:hypothetical protein
MTPAEAARQREVEGLRLSRRRIVQELSTQQDSRHRKMLEEALAHLERKIAKLAVDGEGLSWIPAVPFPIWFSPPAVLAPDRVDRIFC